MKEVFIAWAAALLLIGAIFVGAFLLVPDIQYHYKQSCDPSGECDVWVKGRGDWGICRRDVPPAIPANKVECLSLLGAANEDR